MDSGFPRGFDRACLFFQGVEIGIKAGWDGVEPVQLRFGVAGCRRRRYHPELHASSRESFWKAAPRNQVS